jgi:hypothetical protein
VEIGDSARRHGISDEAMLHAVRQAIRVVDLDEDTTLYIGADQGGTLLEVVVAETDTDDPRLIHAMNLRPKFYDYL